MQIRINKYLALCGIGSRRRSDEILLSGGVRINGRPAKLGDMVDPDKDTVTYKDEELYPSDRYEYFALNKPLGVISTAKDEFGRRNVVDMVKSEQRLFPIGRLDRNSTGLIILTNDGDLALKLTHPKYHLPKVYEVTTEEPVTDEQLEKLSTGVSIYSKKTLPANTERIGYNSFMITIFQGMKRQLREMCKSVGLTVSALHRTEIGPVKLGSLRIGSHRLLTGEEVALLKSE
ncbi:MAG: Pseudouridine synthase [candidate division WWE3 bacterium GW2011_GWF2_41_45]|uniref:Pseudouridine synthase n=3 Tax=Katanobacteria TaxID=422282 RepID=A0A354G3F2_UNCKA|nr:MAG: Pseudouridine synthase [candidate division WWE3 bacterium GW2011_GWC2_41_23]KKS10265.1 MAG: Pseudouridine synthase [candidate division WWE3 bacterium GW2011_GWF2_41_45]KKS12232.1 MAG: Pseudouridine synthase [candidate division WWE3 bacterium GW2011_GWF1_41_53]KKS20007.1 MAG: Pseudouridine synthase [candidate division WWE3 bacterium GW2011_GWE1_41_72]KKS29320.1 MAG: Pseudouridine synthase [candidate division WWE3 bacterium GW2011_GWD2_42_11]KKS50902.1 MAG: Pseudouridine synthase [candid